MIAAENIGANRGGNQAALQTIRSEKIVNPPTRILLAGMEPIAPPAVCSRQIRMEIPESIRKTGGKELRHFSALLVAESRVAAVGAGVLQVYLLMRHVKITAHDHGLGARRCCR